MDSVDVGIASLVLIVVMIYAGVYITVALGLVSFLGVWYLRDNFDVAVNLLTQSAADTIHHEVFAAIPLFALMGFIVSVAGLGQDIYQVANFVFYKVRGGLGIATVAANAIFASVTGSSIASASVFTRVSVPEMRRYGYEPRFSVGVVAGSSVLGMLIPPSNMLIIYAIVTEQSVGQLFIAGIVPGLILAVAYAAAILAMAYFMPRFVGGQAPAAFDDAPWRTMTVAQAASKLAPVVLLVGVVLGGIYGGVVTPTEAGAAGSAVALLIAIARRRMTPAKLWSVLVETGHITAAILFLLIAASIYTRMLGIAGLPSQFGEWLTGLELGLGELMAFYVVLMVVMGTIIETASIILIVVPLFLPAIEAFGADVVWFGIITVVGAEIGLLTPPLGISCFVIKSTINDPTISLRDIFAGAFPFACIMLIVLIVLIALPQLSLALL